MVHGDGYKDSFEQKIDLVYKVRENKELLKKYKWKRNAIEDQLVNHTEITLSAFMCICAIQKLNIVYIDSKKIYTLIDNIDDLSSNLNIIEKTSKGYALFLGTNEEKYKKYTDNIAKLWKLDNLHKPLRGISSYKVKELQEICRKLQIDILNDNKIALKYKSGDYSLWINGTEVSTSTNSNLPSGLISLQFSAGVGGGSGNFFGKVKQLQVFKTALTDDELTILTGTSGVHFYTSYAAMASGLTYKIE